MPDAVFYQIFPDRFASSSRVAKPGPLEGWDAPPTVNGFKGGDLRGVAERLDYLENLGITALWLNPVFSSASNHRYHTYDYLEVDPLLGGNDALRDLLDAAHARDMRVVLDGVFNHASRGFWPFHHVLENGRHSPYREWFHFNPEMLDSGRQIRAYPDDMLRPAVSPEWAGEHAAGTQSMESLGYRAWWDLPALPKLNTDNPHVREYLWAVGEHWVQFGADGWRLDVPGEIADSAFWSEFRRRVRAVNPDAYLVGEIWHVAPEWLQGDHFDGLMNYPLAWAIIGFAAGQHLDLSVAAENADVARNMRTLDGHAFARRVEELAGAYPPGTTSAQLNLVGTHDTPRVLSLCGGDRTSVKLALLLLLTLPGAPCIYYGDEIGLAGRGDPDCRRAFPWDSGRWDRDLQQFVRSATSLRKAEPALRSVGLRTVGSTTSACVFERTDGIGTILVALNTGEDESQVLLASVPTPAGLPSPALTVGSQPGEIQPAGEGGMVLRLPGRSGNVWRISG